MTNNKPSIFRRYWEAWLFLGVCGLAVVMGAWALNGVRLPTNMAAQPDKSVAFLSDSLPDIPVKYQGRVIGQVDDYQLNDGQVSITFNLNERLDMQRADAQLITDPAPAIQLVMHDDAASGDVSKSNVKRRFTVNFAYADVLPLIATAAGSQSTRSDTSSASDSSDNHTDITQDFMDDAETMLIRVARDLHKNYRHLYFYFFPSEESENTQNN